jgi:AhpD family alkylhydroperoxidase
MEPSLHAVPLYDVEWEACVLEPRRDPELETYVRRTLGMVPPAVRYFTPSPWLVRGMASLGHFGSPLVHLDYEFDDLLGLVVSQENSCRYCFAVQEMMLRVHGYSAERVRRVEQDFLGAEIDPRRKMALDLARRISRASPRVTAAEVQPLLEAGWSPAALRELVYVAAYHVFMNRLMAMPAIPPYRDERVADHWALRWAAPVVRLWIGRSWRRARSQPLPPEARQGPWSALVVALDGLPSARALRATLDEALTSSTLPLRTKALVFAVVARSLGCSGGQREAAALAERAGLGAAELDEIVAHLGAPGLAPADAALVPFARVTTRARPIQLQQGLRALREVLTPEETVEAVGLCALANSLCRMSLVTELA